MHTDSKKKDILILGKVPTDGLNYTILTPEAESIIIISELQNKFCLSLYYNRSNRHLLINGVNIYQFKGNK